MRGKKSLPSNSGNEKDDNDSFKSDDTTPKKLKKRSQKTDEDKNIKRYKKLIIKTYFNILEEKDILDKISERLGSDNILRSIIAEAAFKLKDLDFIIRKQWQILKKFNLQEKIYRDESKLITEKEKRKTNEIIKEAIEKLEAAQISGFEDEEVLKNKIIEKIKRKYSIDNEVLNQLKQLFNDPEVVSKEVELIEKREENLFSSLKIIIKNNQHLSSSIEFDRNTFVTSKQELKRYEKELESKSGQFVENFLYNNDLVEENSFNFQQSGGFNQPTISFSQNKGKYGINERTPFKKSLIIESDQVKREDIGKLEEINLTNSDFSFKKINSNLKSEPIKTLKLMQNININDFLVKKNKDICINDLSIMAKNLEESSKNISKPFKSIILNDLFNKSILQNKLSDFEIQILLFLTQVVVKDIVNSKICQNQYEGEFNPEELLKLLKNFKDKMTVD